jgi:hypothetical protein
MKLLRKSCWFSIAITLFSLVACKGPGILPEIWLPRQNETWQLQLHGTINTSYEARVYDLDLFDTPQQTIDMLKAQGKHVVCYFSAGSSENWRADYSLFVAGDKGKKLNGWPGENWLDTRSKNVRKIMLSRLDFARTKRCDGVDPDNVDGYANNSGFPLDSTTQLDFNLFIATAAHARGLSVALKNDIEQIESLATVFDFAVNEQCNFYNECDKYLAFTRQGKAVFNVEYASKYRRNTAGARDKLCHSASSTKIRTLVLPLQLDDSFRYSCN